MKLTYDPKYNVAYLMLRDKPAQVETIHLSDEIKIDLAPDGTVYGIELLNANEQLGSTIVVRDAAGRQSEIKLPLVSMPPAA